MATSQFVVHGKAGADPYGEARKMAKIRNPFAFMHAGIHQDMDGRHGDEVEKAEPGDHHATATGKEGGASKVVSAFTPGRPSTSAFSRRGHRETPCAAG